FPNNTIPASLIDPVAQKVANTIFPAANLPGLANNFVENTVNTVNAPQGDMFMMGGPNSEAFNQNAVLGFDRVVSPAIVNEIRIGFNRFNVRDWANSYGINENNILGIPNGNIPGLAYTSGIANFDISGFAQTGDPGWTNAKRIANIFDYSENLTWI